MEGTDSIVRSFTHSLTRFFFLLPSLSLPVYLNLLLSGNRTIDFTKKEEKKKNMFDTFHLQKTRGRVDEKCFHSLFLFFN
jgi:hypothetical protein